MFGTRGVAEAYTKTIEFKAKDAQLRKAVKDLGVSLKGIDKSLDKINEAFSKSIRGGIKETVKEVGNISKAVKGLTQLASKVEVLPKEKVTQSIRDIRKIKAAMRDLQRTGSPFSTDGRKSDEFNKSADNLQKFVIAVRNGTKALAANEAALSKQADTFARLSAGVKIGSAQYVTSVQAQEKAEQKLRLAQLERIKAQEKLYALGAGDIKQLGTDMTGFKRVTDLLGMEKQFQQGGKRDTIASLTAYRSELENVNRLLQIGSEEYLLTEQAIERMNKRLGVTTKLQRTQSKQAGETAKFYRDIGKQVESIALKGTRQIGKVFEGKTLFGELPRAGLFIGITRGIEELTKRFNFLNVTIGGKGISTWANWTRKAQEAIATVTFGFQGLSAILGGAGWVVGAVKGFIDFEQQAVLSFNRINAARRELDKNMSSWLSKAEPRFGKKGGSIGPTQNKTSLIENLFGPLRFMMTGEGRLKDKLDEIYGAPHRFGDRAPLADRLKENLADARAELDSLHTTSSRFKTQLQKVVDLEERQNIEIKKRGQLYDKASPTKQAEKLEGLINNATKANRKYIDSLQAQKDQQMELFVSDQDKMLQERIAKDNKATQLEMANDKKKNAADLKDFDRRLKEAIEKRRLRQGAMQSAMIGGAFPLLFGQGPFAAAGGAIGGYVGGMRGQQGGFAGSLIGTQVVASFQSFITSTVEVGKAFDSVQGSFDFMSEKALFSSDKIKENVKALIKQGDASKAAAILTEEFVKVFGADSLEKLKKLKDESKELNRQWTKLTLTMQMFIVGPLTTLIERMNKMIGRATVRNELAGKLETLRFLDPAKFSATVSALSGSRDLKTITRATVMGPDMIGGKGPLGLGGLNVSGVRKENLESWLFAVETQINNVMKERGIKLQTLPNYDVKSSQEKFFSAATTSKNGIKPNVTEDKIEADLNKIHELEMKILNVRIDKVRAMEQGGELDKEVEFNLGSQILLHKAKIDLIKAGTNERLKEKILTQFVLDMDELHLETLQEMNQLWKDIGVSIEDGLVSAIEGAIEGTKTLGEVASNVLKQISRQIIQAGVSSFLTKAMPSLFPTRASGGPVSGGSPYIVGEKGPELFVPGSSGNIVPNHAMGGTNNVVVNVDASGSAVQGDARQAEELGSMLAAAVQAELVNQQRPGGLLAGTR